MIAWTREVQRLAQMKMSQNAGADLAFSPVRHAIMKRWGERQRKPLSQDVVTMNDLDYAFGSTKSNFQKYSRGERVRLGQSTLNAVDLVLPGTKSYYEIGPQGVPFWTALAGKITVDDFWVPLVESGQVTDALGLPWTANERLEIEVRANHAKAIMPKLAINLGGPVDATSYKAVMLDQAKVVLPHIPLWEIVSALVDHLWSRDHRDDLDDPFSAGAMNLKVANLGLGALVIAMAQLALNEPDDAIRCREDLRRLMLGFIPVWEHLDMSFKPSFEIASTVRAMTSRL